MPQTKRFTRNEATLYRRHTTTIQKARALRPQLPCFLLTGYVGERAALTAGTAFTLVRKPISAQVLAARIEAELEATRR